MVYIVFLILNGGKGQFICTELTKSSKNRILDSSVSLSYYCDPSNIGLFDLDNGNILIKTANISNNLVSSNSALYCIPDKLEDNVSCSVLYSTINNNNATNTRIIYFNTGESQCEIQSSNILYNQTPNQLWGMICSSGITKIENSCIVYNKSPIIFQGFNETTTHGQIIIKNCTIDQNDIKKVIGNLIYDEWIPNPSPFMNLILCTKDGEYCIAAYDYVNISEIQIPYNQNNYFTSYLKRNKIAFLCFEHCILFLCILPSNKPRIFII